MKNKFISFLLSLVMLAAFVPMSASAAEVASGNCGANGDNVTWVLDDAGTLTISGTGAMADYQSTYPYWNPWNNQTIIVNDFLVSFKDYIRTIIIEGEVTHIGDYAFYGLNMQDVIISEGVKTIGIGAFFKTNSNIRIALPKSLEKISGPLLNYSANSSTFISYNGSRDEFSRVAGSENLIDDKKNICYFTSAEAEQIDVPNIENAETNKDAQAWYVEEQLNVADSQWSIVVGKDGAEQTITEEIGTTFTNATVQYGVVLYNLGDYEVVSVTLEGGSN